MDGVMLSSCIRKFVKIIHLCPPLFCFFQISSTPKFTHTSCGCVERRRTTSRNTNQSLITHTTISSVANYGPNWPDLVRIRTFLGKLVRKRSELGTKSLIFHQNDIFNDLSWVWLSNIHPWHEHLTSAGESSCETFCKEGLIFSNFWSDFGLIFY